MQDDEETTRDENVMRLAHPVRCKAAMSTDFPGWDRVFTPYTWSDMRRVFADNGLLTPAALNTLVQNPGNDRLLQFTNIAAYAPGNAGTEMGSAFATIVYLRQVLYPQPYFLVDDDLLELLENTDLADDIPISMLQPPYPRCYVEFGKSRKTEERVPNIETGLHILEGAYVELGRHHAEGHGLYVMFTGSPLGHTNALDDATDSMFLPLDNPQRTLKDALEWAYNKSAGIAHTLALRTSPHEYTKHSFSCLKLLVKVLLYLNLPDARKTLHPELTDAVKQAGAKKNRAKREKAERQTRMLNDYILVSAPPVRTEKEEGVTGGTVKPHWRRGHYRMQAYGPQYSFHRVILVAPVLVGGAEGLANAAPKYVVR